MAPKLNSPYYRKSLLTSGLERLLMSAGIINYWFRTWFRTCLLHGDKKTATIIRTSYFLKTVEY